MNSAPLSKCELLQKITEYEFSLLDLSLFLDTHPDDECALAVYSELKNRYEEYSKEYTRRYGPICASDVTSDTCWTWVCEAWPWEGGNN